MTTKIKFESESVQLKKNDNKLCKTGCGKKCLQNGWCGRCYAKYAKGHYTADGQISPDILRKKRQEEIKKEQRDSKRLARRIEIVKEELKTKLNSNLLKILSDTNPESNKPKHCERLAFWTSDTVCYSRLFITQNKKCNKCKIHDSSVESLLSFVENSNVKDAKIATAEDNSSPAAGGTNEPTSDTVTSSQ